MFTVLSHHVQIQDQVWLRVLLFCVPSLCSKVFSLGLKRSSKLGDRAQVVDVCLRFPVPLKPIVEAVVSGSQGWLWFAWLQVRDQHYKCSPCWMSLWKKITFLSFISYSVERSMYQMLTCIDNDMQIKFHHLVKSRDYRGLLNVCCLEFCLSCSGAGMEAL